MLILSEHVYESPATLLQSYRYALAGKAHGQRGNEMVNRLRCVFQFSLLDARLAVDPHRPLMSLIRPVGLARLRKNITRDQRCARPAANFSTTAATAVDNSKPILPSLGNYKGNVWVTDARTPSADELKNFPGEDKKGSVVVKFSPEGKILMTLGKPGVMGNPPEALTDPTDVVTDPNNGDVYVAESHMDVADPNLVARISVFDKTGKFLRVIGKTGVGPGEFRTPHALEFDSKGELVVADRHNHRIQILTKAGKFIREYDTFGRTWPRFPLALIRAQDCALGSQKCGSESVSQTLPQAKETSTRQG